MQTTAGVGHKAKPNKGDIPSESSPPHREVNLLLLTVLTNAMTYFF